MGLILTSFLLCFRCKMNLQWEVLPLTSLGNTGTPEIPCWYLILSGFFSVKHKSRWQKIVKQFCKYTYYFIWFHVFFSFRCKMNLQWEVLPLTSQGNTGTLGIPCWYLKACLQRPTSFLTSNWFIYSLSTRIWDHCRCRSVEWSWTSSSSSPCSC